MFPDVAGDRADRIAAIAKALRDPVRVQLVDVLRKHAGKVCVCELVPLFDLSQPTVSHHLKVLTRREFETALAAAGFADIEIRETHRVHEHAGAAIIRARKPSAG